jgi:hypothetical protein
VDVERSLYTFAGFLSEEERSARRQELERLLNAVVVKHEGARITGLPKTGCTCSCQLCGRACNRITTQSVCARLQLLVRRFVLPVTGRR